MNTLENQALKTNLIRDFQETEVRVNGQAQSPFQAIRRAAIQQFEKLGFPTIKNEEWKYANINGLFKQEYNFHVASSLSKQDLKSLPLPRLRGNILYFINGVFDESLSEIVSEEVEILSFAKAYERQPDLMLKYFAKYADYQTNAFTALNTALAKDGVVLHIPDNQIIKEPIILRFISDARTQNIGSQPRSLIVVGKNSEVKIAESFRTLGDSATFTNTVTEIVLEEHAKVDYYKVQNESNQTHHIGTTQVYQESKSIFYAATVTVNGGFVRNNLNIVLDGEHCECFMYGLYMPNGKQLIDNHTVVDHAKPNSQSNELYKGILFDKSTGVFNGKIFVREDAQKTNAYQNCRNVVLSEEATMNTKPQLEIWADDVKCSHGTTTGQLNNEAVFYMQARGIPKKEAQRLLMLAFAQDVVSQIKIDSIRTYLESLILEKLGN